MLPPNAIGDGLRKVKIPSRSTATPVNPPGLTAGGRRAVRHVARAFADYRSYHAVARYLPNVAFEVERVSHVHVSFCIHSDGSIGRRAEAWQFELELRRGGGAAVTGIARSRAAG